ncbi:hypothetical protein DY000_02040894 [Brassica cretica]|uniref:Uncharacterized protein n=1 Tax=Brassica cretica TaxID=69181 RepID=A0ABQ7BLZ2_BRACR|nr:hypothetical protein DY000_02040894 [Brassica cretica]
MNHVLPPHVSQHDGLEARCFRRTTFLQHEVFFQTSYQRNIIFRTLEAGQDLSRTGSKHNRIEARQKKPKLDENPNFGIMEVFDEAEGSGNIYRQGPKSGQWTEKLEVARCMGSERGVSNLTS